MKRTLSTLAVLGIVSMIGLQSAEAFTWSSLNPWSKCNRCEKKVEKCPCTTGYAAPCDPCEKQVVPPCDPCQKQITKPAPCDACDRLQQNMMRGK